MPVRTRSDMHIGLDLALDVLNGSPTNRLDPAVKDYFLNRTISEFVKNVIAKANKPDDSKRVPFRILTYGDIISKYNDIYTLIKIDESIIPTTTTDINFYQYILPTDLFRFETSYSYVRPVDCITYDAASAPTVANSAGAGTATEGLHYYFVTFVYSSVETDLNVNNVASLTIGASKNAELTNIPIGETGCTARKIYRSKVGEPWYMGRLLTTISDNTTTIYTDSTTDANLGALYSGNQYDTQLPNLLLETYDITAFNNNPFGGKRKYIGTILQTNSSTLLSGILNVYHNQRYAINRVGIIYVKKPAILTSSPSAVNCDLPVSVHDTIVDETAKFISAATVSGNYQQLLMEAKLQNQ